MSYRPKTLQARRRQDYLSPIIWNVIKHLGEGEHLIKPQAFLDLVNAELVSQDKTETNVRAVGNILVRGGNRWFAKENFNRYKILNTLHNFPRIAEDLLPPEVIKELAPYYQRPADY